MIINDPNGQAAEVTPDRRLKTVSATETMMHALAEIGKAWTINGSIAAADTTDNVILFFNNTSDVSFDVHRIILSSSIAGRMAVEYGRTYSSGGGTAKSLAQLNTLSGKTQNQISYIANDIILAGTGTDIICNRLAADVPYDILGDTQSLQLEPSATVAVRFQADSGTPAVCVTFVCHGVEPWEE
jgi:hypothetical protein